jgi:porphobilinogen deaminase
LEPKTVQIGYIPSITPPQLLEKSSFSKTILKQEDWHGALVNEEVGAVLLPLWRIPLELDERITIGALTRRLNPRICLVKTASVKNVPKLMDLPIGFKVFSPYEIYLSQLKSIRNDLRSVTAVAADYWLIPHYEIGLQDYFNEDHIVFSFHPKELVPIAGTGVWAYVVHKKHTDLRQQLVSIHHAATTRITNIERGVLKEFEDIPIAIHGTEDDLGYLHFSAFKSHNKRRITYSSGTSHGLVSQLVELLNQ